LFHDPTYGAAIALGRLPFDPVRTSFSGSERSPNLDGSEHALASVQSQLLISRPELANCHESDIGGLLL
jgi:hypothetical protein